MKIQIICKVFSVMYQFYLKLNSKKNSKETIVLDCKNQELEF